MVFVSWAAAAQPPPETSPTPTAVADSLAALVVERGSIARQEVVGLGRGVTVYGEALADVAALEGPIRIEGRVAGNVICMGDDVTIGAGGRVEGDVFVLGGRLLAAPGAFVGGRSVSYPEASRAWVTLLEGPALGASPTSPIVIGAKLALLAAWAALLIVFFASAGGAVLSTARSVAAEPFRNFGVGLVAVLALLLTGLFLSGLTSALVGVPLLVLIVLFGLVLKLWGMIAVFAALGTYILRKLWQRRVLPLTAASAGLVVLGLLKFVPWIGAWVWMVATLIGVGATLVTKFGRREPWFRVGELDPVIAGNDPIPTSFAGFRRPR